MRGIVVSEKYVVHGAKLKCSGCADESCHVDLKVTDDRRIKINGEYVANKSDVFAENISDFGECKNLSPISFQGLSPQVQFYAMQQTSRVIDIPEIRDFQPCALKEDRTSRESGGRDILTPWLDCKEDVLVAGHPAVVESSYIMCTAGGGMITVDHTGQDG